MFAATVALMIASGNAWAGQTAASTTIILANPSAGGGLDYFHNLGDSELGGSASINLTSGPSVSAYGSSQGIDFASAALTYYFAVSGPLGAGSIPVDITYSYDFIGIVGFTATGGSLHLTGAGVSSTYILNTNSDSGTTTGDQREISATNQVYMATLTAGAQATIGLSVGANGAGSSAFLDPTITVDPTYLANSGYTASQFTVSQSAGVANGVVSDTTVPEPASMALLGSCLTGLALVRRVRRR